MSEIQELAEEVLRQRRVINRLTDLVMELGQTEAALLHRLDEETDPVLIHNLQGQWAAVREMEGKVWRILEQD